MSRLLTALLRIGADPRDSEDVRLRKVLVLGTASMVVPASMVWGAVGAGTARLLGDGAETASLGAREVKGKDDPVEAYALLGLRPDGSQVQMGP